MRRLLFIAVLFLILTAVEAFGFDYDKGPVSGSLGGYIEGIGVAPTIPSPRENPTARIMVDSKTDFGKLSRFAFSLRGEYDGTVLDPQTNKLFLDFDHIYQNRNPYLSADETYIDFYAPKIDIRAGIQKFSWGRLDEIAPTDMLNTPDMTNPFVYDENERKIGTPSIKANLYTDYINIEAAWIPRWTPYRMPHPDERWFPTILIAPESFQIGAIPGFTTDSITVPVTAAYPDIDLPDFSFENSQAGIQFTKSLGSWELGASYFYGYDKLPVFSLPVDLSMTLNSLFPLDYSISADVTLKPELYTIQMYGLDFSTTAGDFTIRGEAAYFHDRCYMRELESLMEEYFTPEENMELITQFIDKFLHDPELKRTQTISINPPFIVKKDSARYGLGADYIKGDLTLTVQAMQEYIFNYDKKVLFNKNGFDTNFTLSCKYALLDGTLEPQISAMYGIEYAQFLIKPSVSYAVTDNLKVTVYALILGGESDSLLGQYRNNDEGAVKIRYSF